ncbi:MAG: hypothetical protein KY475_08190 [Planctomycetes bacterium]|nr:hypothetical protein [Planctomycetota bacterium]
MAFERTRIYSEPVTETPCIHLRSKAMYVTGVQTPKHPDEAGGHYCWCNMTQHTIGPDRKDVDARRCGPERDCYRQSH